MTVTEEQLKALRTIENEVEPTPGSSAPNFRGVKTNKHPVYKCPGAGESD